MLLSVSLRINTLLSKSWRLFISRRLSSLMTLMIPEVRYDWKTPSRNLQDAALTCQVPDSHTHTTKNAAWRSPDIFFSWLGLFSRPFNFSPAMETAHPASSGAALWSEAGVCACAAHCLRCTGFSKLDVRRLHHHIQNPIKTVAMESIGKTPHIFLLCPLIVAVACAQRYGCILCLFSKRKCCGLGM